MQLDSVSKFSVRKDGSLYLGSNVGNLEIRNGSGGRAISLGTSSSGIGINAADAGNNRVTLGGNVACTGGSFYMVGSNSISFANTDPWSPDLFLTRKTGASLRLGAADTTGTTAPTAQTLGVQSWASSTNPNQAGATFTIAGSQGTGSGAGGSIVFQTSAAGTAGGTTPNALATRLTIAPTGSATFGGNIGVGNITPGGVSSSIYGLNDCYINIGGSGQLRFVGAGTTDIASFIYNFGQIGLNIQSAGHISFTSGANSQGTVELRLSKDGAHILAQRLGTNAQTSRIYTTYASATDYARLSISAQSDRNRIASEAQTQTVKPLEQTFYTSASDPTTANITDGAFGMWKNSGTGLLKLWANDGGTMKSIVLT
jgi:hypothetical protein